MAAKKIKDKDRHPKQEIYFVTDNDLYIYEMLEREQNCEAINEKNNTKKKIKNQKN